MGRRTTGAQVTSECKKVELSTLIKKGLLKNGRQICTSLTWRNDQEEIIDSVRLRSKWSKDEQYIQLSYTISDHRNSMKYDYDYKVYLTAVASNLGKGEVLYFVCPVTLQRCRTLFLAYDSHIWKSRKAYKERIYYSSQLASKRQYANTRYWDLERRIQAFQSQENFRWTYNGKPTAKAKKLIKMQEEQVYWDEQRWSMESLPKSFLKVLGVSP